MPLTWDRVWSQRLARHRLSQPAPKADLVEVVGAIGGVHAQVAASADLSIGIRLAAGNRDDVRAELWQRRRLVKTYGQRGTVHLFPSAELPRWLAALRAARSSARRPPSGEHDDPRTQALIGAIGEALDGARLTREQLGREVARRVGPWALEKDHPAFGKMWPRWWAAIGTAATAGALCFGPSQGSRVTFVRPDQWVGPWEEVDGAEALAEVFRRYLSAYGPATPQDFARWFYLDESAARQLARSLSGDLQEVDVEGWRALLLAEDAERSWENGAVTLLPRFDEYVIGCAPRDRLVPPDLASQLSQRELPVWARRAFAHGSVSTVATLLVDGIVAGVWEQRVVGKTTALRVESFRELSESQRRSLEVRAGRIGEILQTTVLLELGTVTVRPHL